MNMKKTIAALAAGAVAVSAMATTVSALADTSLTYNLVKDVKVNKFDAHKATFEYTINARPAGVTADVTLFEANDELTAAEFEALTEEQQKLVEKTETTAESTYVCNADYADANDNDIVVKKGTVLTKAEYDALAAATVDYSDYYDEVKGATTTTYTAKEDIINKGGEVVGGYPTALDLNNPGEVESIVIKVASSSAGEQNKIFTYSAKDDALNYNPNLKKTGEFTFSDELAQYNGQLTITVTTNVTFDGTREDLDEVKEINALIANGTINATADAGDITPVKLNAFTKGGKVEKVYYAPFKTAITGNENITRYLQNVKGYHNVGAVLNDAIENYESVTFTFNTATNPIAYGVKAGTYTIPKSKYTNWVEETRTFAVDCEEVYSANDKWWEAGTYEMALDAVGGDASRLMGIYAGEAWAGDSSFLSFDQHLYQGTNNLYGSYADGTSYKSENTGYLGFDWTGYNLFQGALIINENLTMSLAETDYFDWTATSLSFDWDAIMDGAMTSNDYAVYLHSMKLATSNTWYWDNMVVTLTAGAAEDGVDAEAGVEADDEELTEEPVEEEAVEEEVEEEVEVEVANPTTGNASVALAVIPVALAAAAVVAKKRS